jgi:hypothetical protein
VQEAIDKGLPKTKRTGMPFRMEMSGFARLEGSIPVTGDIGAIWPLMVCAVEEELGMRLDFVCAPQETDDGKRMRDWIVEEVAYIDRRGMYEAAQRTLTGSRTANSSIDG